MILIILSITLLGSMFLITDGDPDKESNGNLDDEWEDEPDEPDNEQEVIPISDDRAEEEATVEGTDPESESIENSGPDEGDEEDQTEIWPDVEDAETNNGTYESETIRGTDGADVIFGGVGDDVLDGYGGQFEDSSSSTLKADSLYDLNADTIFGGLGADTIFASAGDEVHTGDGSDKVHIIWALGHGNVSLLDFEPDIDTLEVEVLEKEGEFIDISNVEATYDGLVLRVLIDGHHVATLHGVLTLDSVSIQVTKSFVDLDGFYF